MRQFIKKTHLWLSLPFCIIFILTCFTGSILTFEEEFSGIFNPQLYKVKYAEKNPLPYNILMEKAQENISNPNAKITGITIFPDKNKCWRANLSAPKNSFIAINQYTGEIQGEYQRNGFFINVFKLHRWLLDGWSTEKLGFSLGKLLVGISTLLAVFVLLSGIILWVPKTKAAVKQRFTINFRKGLKRFLYDIHVSAGIYVVLILLICCVTGLTWSFEWYNKAFYSVLGVETVANQGNNAGNKMQKGDTEKPKTIVVLENLENKFNSRAQNKYVYDYLSGELLSTEKYADKDRNGKVKGVVYSLHVGNWWGVFSKFLYLFATIIGGTLPITGIRMWLNRIKRKKSVAN